MQTIKIGLAAFCFLIAITVSAQQRYEYGQVTYGADMTKGGNKNYFVATSIGGAFTMVEEGKLTDGGVLSNFTPVNKVLNELSDKGWEIYSTGTATNLAANYYYMRKKKGE